MDWCLSRIERLLLCFPVALTLACSSPAGDEGFFSQGGEESSSTASTDSEDSSKETGSGEAEDGGKKSKGEDQWAEQGQETIRFDVMPDAAAKNATIEGTVFSPEGSIPVSEALVYVTPNSVDSIPDGVYCETCVELDPTISWTQSNEDGSFSLDVTAGEDLNLVIQKGQFQRIRKINIAEGDNSIDSELTTLPKAWAPEEGDWIPRMAIAYTTGDSIYNLMAKVGLGDTQENGDLVDGSQQFDIWGGGMNSKGPAVNLLNDLEEMKKYHIIFIPCMSQGEIGPVTEEQKANIREWIDLGGKWYVTDWANEFLYEPFPNYQDFYNPESPDLGAYDTEGEVKDAGLLNWLEALPDEHKDPGEDLPTLYDLPRIQLIASFSALEATHEVIAQDADGQDVNVGHYTWVEGSGMDSAPPEEQIRPMTVSARHGCGKMMFSTYHTSGAGNSTILLPQELILWYLILEIGVCQDGIVD